MRNWSTTAAIRCAHGLVTLVGLLGPIAASAAVQYGIYEARGMAMGGATVAAGTNDNAIFYNPALLAFYDEIEENTHDSRFLFPLLVPQLTDSVADLNAIASSDPDEVFDLLVSNFNADPSAVNAQAVAAHSADLEGRLAQLANQSLLADYYAGLAIIQPSRKEGGGFFIGTRLVAGGLLGISPADLALLDDYEQGLNFVATGGAQGVAHPELFDANGALIDPSSQLDSTVAASGVGIIEMGVAMSKELTFRERPVALGTSLKFMRIDTFEDVERVIDRRINSNNNDDEHLTLNADFGAAVELSPYFRLGLGIKDLIPRDLNTGLGTTIKLRPRVRFGSAYQRGRLQLALDVDLKRNEPLGTEPPSQEVALGAEFALFNSLRLRAGYRHDLESFREDIVSIGLGAKWKRFLIDVAYADGDDTRAAAVQFGYAFY